MILDTLNISDWTAPCYVYLILGCGFVYGVIYRLLLGPLYFSPMRNMPGPPLGNLVFGQFSNMIMSEPGLRHMEWAEKYGPVIRFIGPFGFERLLFLEPSALHRILVSEWLNFPRPASLRHTLGITAGYGLLTVTGNVHKLMRKTMNPAFSLTNLIAQTDMYYPPLEGFIKILYTKISNSSDLKNGIQLLMYDWMSKVTLDIICATAFDYHPDSVHQPDNELAVAYHQLLSLQSGANLARLFAVMSIPGFPALLRTKFAVKYRNYLFRGPLKDLRILVLALKQIKRVSHQMLDEKLSEIDVKDSESKRDIMSLLVRARMDDQSDGYKMSDNDLIEQVTTASGLSWTLWLLAKNPECQKRLRDEVLPCIQDNPRPDYRTLKDLAYLDGVVMESLRVMPPVPFTIREAKEKDWIDGYYIPKGTMFYIPIRAVNTWTKIWGPDAKEFRPERWSNLPSTYNSNFSLLSFIAGPHSCIGRTMAIMEMKAIIAVLIAHFSFEPAYENQRAQPTAAITMKPADGLPLKVTLIGKVPLPP
ncbi:hypothetical protein Clacol_010231 [Clathrus columnatus]|uniref:Cytochrome P450 n=1 Tax=Clathrus columnatus TaxID=1419009 RepID=A0AAV5AQ65_9AGAM|nr:hypothetical protein Clacol_010231 [Clathrus columnatus]